MRAEVKHILVRDSAEPLETSTLAGRIELLVSVGAVGTPGADDFSLTVSTPAVLADSVTEEHQGSRRFLRGWLVVQRLNAEVIRQAIEDLCRRYTGESWPEVRKRLDRYLLPDDEDLTSWSA